MRFFIASVLLLLCFPASLKADEAIQVGCSVWKPYADPDATKKGVLGALVSEVAEISGIKIEMTFLPWKRAVEMTKNGKLAGLFCATYKKEREAWLVYHERPIIKTATVLFKRKDRKISWRGNVTDLKPYTIAILRGSVHVKTFEDAGEFKLKRKNDELTKLRLLLSGRVDVAPTARVVGWNLIKNHFASKADQFDVLFPPFKEDGIHIAIGKNYPNAQDISQKLNNAVSKLWDSGTAKRILNEYGVK